MCNLSEGILETGREEGRKEGRIEGIHSVLAIIDRREEFPYESIEETASAVGCDVEDVLAVINRKKRSWR